MFFEKLYDICEPALKSFENEMYDIVSNADSGSIRNDLQDNQKEDENQICYYKNLLVFADSWTSTYKMSHRITKEF